MKIQLILYASLASFLPPGSSGNCCEMEVREGSTVKDVMDGMQVPPEAPKIFFVNGRHAKQDQQLQEGDRVAVFPPIAGG